MADELGFTDDESVEERAFDYARTVALSDGVFSIAMTLLVLNIAIPSLAHPDLIRRRRPPPAREGGQTQRARIQTP